MVVKFPIVLKINPKKVVQKERAVKGEGAFKFCIKKTKVNKHPIKLRKPYSVPFKGSIHPKFGNKSKQVFIDQFKAKKNRLFHLYNNYICNKIFHRLAVLLLL